MLPRIEYIHWIEGRPEAATHDLGTSDLRLERPGSDQVVPDSLRGLEGPGPDVTLAEQVADAYGVSTGQVVVTAGATQAYHLSVSAALSGDAGDRVLVERPGYEPLRRTPEALGGTVDRFRRPREDGHLLSAERVRGAAGEETAMVVATNRHNPSGRLADRSTLADAAAAAEEAGARLLVDEVYAPYTASPVAGAFGGPTAAGLDGAVATGSLTKFHGLGGLRVGWVVADEAFVERVRRARAYLPTLAAPSEALARRAFANPEAVTGQTREHLRRNHDLLLSFVEARPDLTGPVHDGAPFALLGHDAADGDEVAAAAWKRDLLVVPGRFFEDADRFRVSLGGEPDQMAAALDVLGETLDAL